jgi:hypothetical protein
MIETELLTFPLEGKGKFIAEMKTFNALLRGRKGRSPWRSLAAARLYGKKISFV